MLEGVSCAWSVEGLGVVRVGILLFGLLSFDSCFCATFVPVWIGMGGVVRRRVFVIVSYDLVVVWAGVRYFIGFFNYLEFFFIFL